jgi:hypothetical protein
MSKGSAWGILGLASIVACLHAMPARAMWTATETPDACVPAAAAATPAAQAPVVASESGATADGPAAIEPLDETTSTLEPADGEGDGQVVEIVLDESPAPDLLAAAGRTCCFYRSGSSPPVGCRERTCVPIGEQCPLEVHGCPLWTWFSVNSCGACR